MSDDPPPPQIVAHRGASETVAEHTLGAYEQALVDGADALECDVRLTADGHLVCVHDRRLERTSNAGGIVSTMELAELQRLDFSAWKDPWRDLDDEAPDIDLAKGGILTLESLLALVRDHERSVEIAIETKHPTRYASLVERRLVELLDVFGWARPVNGRRSPARVMSYSWLSLRRIRDAAPDVATVFLMDRVPIRFRDGSLPLGSRIAGPAMPILRSHPKYVARAHRMGHEVHVFTVNDTADVELCLDLGVDAIITDRPAALRAMIDATRS